MINVALIQTESCCAPSLLQDLLFLAVLPVTVVYVLRIVFPNSALLRQLSRLWRDLLVYFALLPFKVLGHLLSLLHHRRNLADIFASERLILEDFQVTPQQFYDLVEHAIGNRVIPGSTISKVAWREGGLFSARREYLLARRKERLVIIGATPFGTSFIISWWFGDYPLVFTLLLEIPLLGFLLERFIKPTTFYRVDTASAFQRVIHTAIIEVVNEVTEVHGIHAPAQHEHVPLMHELYPR